MVRPERLGSFHVTEVIARPRFRTEIQGLRATAALMIAVYHIWFNKVSGGVDVFFVLSGFLIIGSLSRELSATGSIAIATYYTRIARRILPLAYVVLVAAVAGSLLFVSRMYWADVFAGVRAAALYVANNHLSANSVEYLNQDAATSPVQHFWAMSIQAQFYLVVPLVMLAAWRIAVARGAARSMVVVVTVASATLLSFGWSVVNTPRDPAPMYFDALARVWEFGVGGLVALLLARVVVSETVGAAMAWAGLVIVFLNAVFIGNMDYPGWVAMVPVAGAVLVILAGQATRLSFPIRVLGSAPLARLGDYSYGFFLWHWPLLIFGKLHYGVDSVSFVGGVAIIGASLLLAVLTHRVVEAPFLIRRSGGSRSPVRGEFVALAAVLALIPVVTLAVEGRVNDSVVIATDAEPGDEQRPTDVTVPVAAASPLFDPARPLRPDPLVADDDRGQTSIDGCFVKDKSTSRVEICAYGDPTGPTIALVGGSHALHWFSAMRRAAERHRWDLQVIVKVTCRYGVQNDSSCGRWVTNTENHLLANPPALVVTTSSVASKQKERVPDEYVDRWRVLSEAGIPILGIRDTPWFPYSVPACVDENRDDPTRCGHPRDQLLSATNPATTIAASIPQMTLVDFTDHLCDDTTCHGVIDNIVTYRDRDHITATFAARLAPVMERALLEVLDSNADGSTDSTDITDSTDVTDSADVTDSSATSD